MTALADVPTAQQDDPQRPAGPLRRSLRQARSRAVSLGFVALVVALVTVFLVEDPVAHVWYQSRQQHLATDYALPHKVHVGDALSVIQVPDQAINVIVVQGDGPGMLRAGPGHRPGTPVPGQLGNSIVFGHRSGWGGTFSSLGKLAVGARVFVQSKTANGPGQAIFFKVMSVRTVSATDRRPFARSDDFRLTLVTSAPTGRRLVISAVSGAAGQFPAPGPPPTAGTGASGPALTWPIVGLATSLLALAAVILLGRRRRATRSLAVVATPLVLGALVAAVLVGDTVLRSPLS